MTKRRAAKPSAQKLKRELEILNVVPVDRTGAPQKNVIEFIEGALARAD